MHLGHTVNRLFIGAKIGVWYLEYFLFRPVATPALPKIIEIQVMSYLLVFLCVLESLTKSFATCMRFKAIFVHIDYHEVVQSLMSHCASR